MNIVTCWILFVDHFGVWQSLRHCHEPAAFLALKRHRVDLFHHRAREARAIAEDHVGVGPLELENVAEHDLKPRTCCHWPAEDLLVNLRRRLCHKFVILCLQVDGDILQ